MKVVNYKSVPIITYNDVIQKKDYYISLNQHDLNIYGDITTAIVVGQMEKFYILNGNHVEHYNRLKTLQDCLQYFKEQKNKINKYSDIL